MTITGTFLGKGTNGSYYSQSPTSDTVHMLNNDGAVVKGFKRYPTSYRLECRRDCYDKVAELQSKHFVTEVIVRDGSYQSLFIIYRPQFGYKQFE